MLYERKDNQKHVENLIYILGIHIKRIPNPSEVSVFHNGATYSLDYRDNSADVPVWHLSMTVVDSFLFGPWEDDVVEITKYTPLYNVTDVDLMYKLLEKLDELFIKYELQQIP